MRRRLFSLAMLASVGSLSGCLEATEVTFSVTTDVPCDRVNGTAITVGIEGQTEKATPTKLTNSCNADGMVTAIGTYAVTPKKGKTVVASAKVVVAVGSETDLATSCTAAMGYKGCIVARRRISFLPQRSLTVPIEILLRCKDVQCDENSTCNRAGRCVNSVVDTDTCSEDTGECTSLKTVPGEGLACFNSAGATPLFCAGDNAWCTLSATGVRACAKVPADGGVSLQCRNSEDCGPHLFCVAGSGGIIGECRPETTPDTTVLCTFGEATTPCEAGPFACSVDAGNGLFTCKPPQDGGLVHDGGLACPRTPNLYCYAPTPNCDTITGTPTCVADGGAQCWYPSDCPAGTACFAGPEARFFNSCQADYTQRNPVALCNEARDGGDCPTGMTCTGNFYGLRACQDHAGAVYHWGNKLPCPLVGGDGGLTCDGPTPACQETANGFACTTVASLSNDAGTTSRQWQCRNSSDCAPGSRCVYQRNSDTVTSCQPIQLDAGQAVVCEGLNDCVPGTTCGLARTSDGLSLCSNNGPTCDATTNFFSSVSCAAGNVCCQFASFGIACTSLAVCVNDYLAFNTDGGVNDGGTSGARPIACNSATQCGTDEYCIRTNPGVAAPNAGSLCVHNPPIGNQVTVRDIHCQPETEARDCQLFGRTFCRPTFGGVFHCETADGGYPPFFWYPDGGM